MMDRYERYRSRYSFHDLLLYGLMVSVLAWLVVMTISIEALRRDMQGVRMAQKNLNARFHVEYNTVTPPPAWMRK